MGALTQRTTIYLKPELYRALRLKSVETSQSVSEIVNNAVRLALAEDAEDLAAFDTRKKEPEISFEKFIKDLKSDGRI